MKNTRRPRQSWTGRALRKLFRLTPADERLFEEQRRHLDNKEHFLHDMSVIDAKSSALLTHVSIMLAVVAVLLAQPSLAEAGGAVWKWIFTAELIAFSAVGVLLLRCVDILGPPLRRIVPETLEPLEDYYRREILLRRAIFQYMVRTVRFLTVFLIVAVVIKAALDAR